MGNQGHRGRLGETAYLNCQSLKVNNSRSNFPEIFGGMLIFRSGNSQSLKGKSLQKKSSNTVYSCDWRDGRNANHSLNPAWTSDLPPEKDYVMEECRSTGEDDCKIDDIAKRYSGTTTKQLIKLNGSPVLFNAQITVLLFSYRHRFRC
ncbi:unnamed protein product [Allacma fusca]|uniref:Uncharacterized protein n=1 Tax=Allacma fusca TaxID=39272 RepID=A0A8J2LGX5_9HEXA|nr:unnamed protein product [Allacma fusca]